MSEGSKRTYCIIRNDSLYTQKLKAANLRFLSFEQTKRDCSQSHRLTIYKNKSFFFGCLLDIALYKKLVKTCSLA